MGGLVFKNLLNGQASKRLSKQDYLVMQARIESVLQKHFNFYHIIEAFKNKQDFGDIDILAVPPTDLLIKSDCSYQILFREILKNELGASHVSQNTETFSYLIDGFQCDIITTSKEIYDINMYYLDFDPLGNLSGKLAHKFGLKFGHDGLNYIFRDGTVHIGQITISKNFSKICEFLGLNYEKYCLGFNNQTDIFDWIIESPNFDYNIFSYENMNHIARTRDRKRSSYQNFMAYIEQYKDRTVEWKKDKDFYLPQINKFFPESNLIKKIEKLKLDCDNYREATNKFNGKLVSEWTGLIGKELGDAIARFKNQVKISCVDWKEYILKTTAEEIKESFMKFYRESSGREMWKV